MEIWDIYDRERKRSGKQIKRGEVLEEGDYHLVIHVCLFNRRGEMLIQQRQPDKEDWKNMWDLTVGGSAIAGENSQQAAEREVQEEIGYSLNLKDKRPSLTINFDRGFDDYYLLERDIIIHELPLPTEEVKQVKWATKNEIIEMISSGIFIPYHQPLIELLFAMKNKMGSKVMKRGERVAK